jgi:hypothetical protein
VAAAAALCWLRQSELQPQRQQQRSRGSGSGSGSRSSALLTHRAAEGLQLSLSEGLLLSEGLSERLSEGFHSIIENKQKGIA